MHYYAAEEWSETKEPAVDRIKMIISEAPFLSYSSPEEMLELLCDASGGLQVVLMKSQQPVTFAS